MYIGDIKQKKRKMNVDRLAQSLQVKKVRKREVVKKTEKVGKA